MRFINITKYNILNEGVLIAEGAFIKILYEYTRHFPWYISVSVSMTSLIENVVVGFEYVWLVHTALHQY